MPSRVLHYEGAALAAVELSGAVTWPDIAAALRALYLHPAFERGSAVLWDVTGVTTVDVPPETLADARAAFEEVAEARAGGRTAFLVAPGEEGELWALFPRLGPSSSRRVEAFHGRAEALAFLGRVAMPETAMPEGGGSTGAPGTPSA